jgi:hypothetical protein
MVSTLVDLSLVVPANLHRVHAHLALLAATRIVTVENISGL